MLGTPRVASSSCQRGLAGTELIHAGFGLSVIRWKRCADSREVLSAPGVSLREVQRAARHVKVDTTIGYDPI